MKKQIIAKNETQVVAIKQANSPQVDSHVFSLHEGGDSDGRTDPTEHDIDHHHHHNQHGDGEAHDTVDNEEIEVVDEIINKERKLSGKFSGIAKILEMKMEPGFLTLLRNFISQYLFLFQPRRNIVWRRMKITCPERTFCFLEKRRFFLIFTP